jgi:CRISPR-associated endonuclease/helicase Cas3
MPLDVQNAAARMLADHGRVIAALPTGSGKTLLAALPFAAGLLAPKQMVFMTPLRTLTDAQTFALRDQINGDQASAFLGVPWDVRAQTGAAADDPLFTAPAIVCTFDQALSSALAIAYSTSRRRREIIAGAVLPAYLVADELHLFPRDQALTTLLWLLKHRPDLPFTLMTATLSRPIAAALADVLDATLLDTLGPGDVEQLKLTHRQRTVQWQDAPFEQEDLLCLIENSPDLRALIVVNTVARAQQIGRALTDALGEQRVLVLHARFYREHRERIEIQLQDWVGRAAVTADAPRVLVATQVVEAGLDISAGLLCTEWAPANALVQRWGRCARWGGVGQVVVAPPPGDGVPAPYRHDAGMRDVLERTRTWLRTHAMTPLLMTDDAERALLDAAHAADDERWVGHLEQHLRRLSTWIGQAIATGAYSHGSELIRRVDNRTVLVHEHPEALGNPWLASGFSLARGTLFGLLCAADGAGTPKSDDSRDEEDDVISLELPTVPWVLKRPIWETEGERRAAWPARWEVATRDDLTRETLFALNPEIVGYDARYGLTFLGEAPTPPGWWSTTGESEARPDYAPYQRETCAAHVSRMLTVLEERQCLWPTLRAVVDEVEASCGWSPGILKRVIRAAIVLHDAGKLTDRWQAAARAYQQAAGQPADEPWLVHTDERKGVKLQGAGPHALTGAAYSLALGRELDDEVNAWRDAIGSERWDDEALPSRVLFTAIAHHHGPDRQSYALGSDELLPPAAVRHLQTLLTAHGLSATIVPPPVGVPLDEHVVDVIALDQAGADVEYIALSVVARLLRLADGWSQEHIGVAMEAG